jgi:hypothetical protein
MPEWVALPQERKRAAPSLTDRGLSPRSPSAAGTPRAPGQLPASAWASRLTCSTGMLLKSSTALPFS